MIDEEHIEEAKRLCTRARRFSTKMSSMMSALKDVTDKKAEGWIQRITRLEKRIEQQELAAYKQAIHTINVLKIGLPASEKAKIDEIETRLKEAENTLSREFGAKQDEFATHVRQQDWPAAENDLEEIRTALREANEDFTSLIVELSKIEEQLHKNPSFGVENDYSHAKPHEDRRWIEKDIIAQRAYAKCFTEFNIIEGNIRELVNMSVLDSSMADAIIGDINNLRATLQNKGYIYQTFMKNLMTHLVHVMGFNIETRKSLGDPKEDALLNGIYDALIKLRDNGNILRKRRDNPDGKNPHWQKLDYLRLDSPF